MNIPIDNDKNRTIEILAKATSPEYYVYLYCIKPQTNTFIENIHKKSFKIPHFARILYIF